MLLLFHEQFLEDEEWPSVQNLQGKKGPSKITKDICTFF
jgi:hypothetical protein